MTTIIASFIHSLRPDHSRQWKVVIPRLLEELPELFILGNYCPEKRTDPAIWLRSVVARKIEEAKLPADQPSSTCQE
jgi:hypothetical protein